MTNNNNELSTQNVDVEKNNAELLINKSLNNNHNNNNNNNNNNYTTSASEGEPQPPIQNQQKQEKNLQYPYKTSLNNNNNNNNSTPSSSPSSPSTSTFINDISTTQSKLSAAFRKKSVFFRISCALVSCLIVICFVTTVTLLWYYMGWIYGVQAIVVALIAVLGASGIWHWCGHWLYIAAVTGPRDVKGLYRYVKLLSLVRRYQKNNFTLGDIFETFVAKHPNKACLIFEDKIWTFKQVNDFANKIANHYQLNGFKNGDVIGLFMENRPEFVSTWLGLSKIGIIVPLINTNLRCNALLHSITVANCNALIYGDSLQSAINEIKDELPESLVLYEFNDNTETKTTTPAAGSIKVKDLFKLMETSSTENIIHKDNNYRHHNKLLYIYTSGTTGLPKAAVISHSRYIFIAAGIHYVANFRDEDIFYTPLPLYHTAGGVMSIGQAILFGSTVVIRKKFSASGYFVDCQKYKCTVAQYIGEMCRYVLATKPAPVDKAHHLRCIFGNGLRPQIWPQFVERFNIPNVAEFYGATEGNANIVNIDNTVGAIGFVSRIIPMVYPISIIRADPNTGEPIRGPNGLCQLCRPNEPGVFIGKIIPNNPSRAFLGYVDKQASSKKVVHDVFKKGDSAFLSGDVLVADERGYLFFKDRTGDTFRWKGENVSTSEVEAQVSNVAGYRDTVVYGVEIPHMEGRAGMAAILDAEKTVDLEQLSSGIRKLLPSYARPQFIRLLTKVDMTGTFKLKKLDLQKDGFDPSTIEDQLYYLTTKGTYDALDRNVFEQIRRGEIRF